MATISSAGIGSGLDVNGIITKLMQVESQPLSTLAKQESSFQAKLSAFGSLQGALSSLQSSASTLKSATTFSAKSASSSDTSVLTASAATDAAIGTHSVVISQLAKFNVVRSNVAYTSTADTFNTGTLSIKVGNGAAVDVAIGGDNSLDGIRKSINSTPGVGVTAAILNDGTAKRLVLTSSTMGSPGEISVTAADDGSGGTYALADLDTASGNTIVVQSADDAEFTVDGTPMTRSTNSVSDAISGVTLNLIKGTLTSPGSATLTIGKNTDAASTAISGFVKAYNEVISQLKSATAYDAATKKASVLTGDSTARSVRTKLVGAIQAEVTGIAGSIGRLSDIGIRLQSDGTLAVDSNTLGAALSDPDKDVSSLFRQSTSGNEGIAVRLDEILDGLIGSEGLIPSRTDGINANIKSVQQRTEVMNRRLEQIEQRYRAQFSALDALLAGMQRTSQYLTQQLASISSTSNQ